MKYIFTITILLTNYCNYSQSNYDLAWSTYFGGNKTDGYRCATDTAGNLYIAGVTENVSPFQTNAFYNLFSTPGAFVPTINNKSCILVKLSPNGTLIWSTYIGFDFLDTASLYGFPRIMKILFDSNNNMYLIGGVIANQLWTGAPITMPLDFDFYEDDVNGFIAKFNINGQQLWGKYLPFGCDNALIDSNDKIYINGITRRKTGLTTAGVFQANTDPNTSFLDVFNFLTCYDTNGAKVWATYNGFWAGNAKQICMDNNNNIYCVGTTYKLDNFHATANCYQSQNLAFVPNNYTIYSFISKFNDQGQRIWSTYYGLDNNPNVKCEANVIGFYDNNLYIAGITNNSNNIATVGTSQSTPFAPYDLNIQAPYNNNVHDGFLAKFNLDGQRLWGTYFGGEKRESVTSLSVNNNKIIVAGQTLSTTNIVTTNTYQNVLINYIQTSGFSRGSGYIMEFDTNGTTKSWGTYLADEINDCIINPDNSLYAVGTSIVGNFATTPNCIQPIFNKGYPINISTYINGNMTISRFNAVPLSTNAVENQTNTFQIYPNPSNGSFTITSNVLHTCNNISVYDLQGRVVFTKKTNNSTFLNENINFQNQLQNGVYFVKLMNDNIALKTSKIIVE